MIKLPNIAIIGATGLVGTTMLKVLEEFNIEIGHLYLYASKKSVGRILKFRNKDYQVIKLKEEFIKDDIDIALFATSKDISKTYIPIFIDKGIYVIDNSSYFRNNLKYPLVTVGVNDSFISKNAKLIVNPNCSTIQSVLALNLIHNKYKLVEVNYTTLQAVSGSGYIGLLDLVNSLEGKKCIFYEKQIAFNVLPVIGDIDNLGNSSEETKMINETKRIFEDQDLKITATCIRVPVVNSHSISINLVCHNNIEKEALIDELKKDKYLKIYEVDYPTPKQVSGTDEVHIGRIRQIGNKGLSLWLVADNLRVGAATNAIRILEKLWKEIIDDI